MNDGFIPPHGNYRKLRSYQRAVIVYDGTTRFCGRYFSSRDRTVDQMVQAARSGKQNIVEGCQASGHSKETEIKLIGVAQASLAELEEDYLDFLRVHNLQVWPREHRYSRRISELLKIPDASYIDFQKGIENKDPEIAANVLLSLTRVTCYLLDRQLKALERAFIKEGGIKERMLQARLRNRRSEGREGS